MIRIIPGEKIALFILVLNTFSLYSQSTSKDFIRAVQEADQYFYFSQDYESSAKLYNMLLKKYPGNNNLQAKLGISYLNVDGRKKEALDLLKKASADVVTSDIKYTEYGKSAPLDTWFYLAHAYHLNDSLDKALEIYSAVRKKMTSNESFRIEYIDNQIKACNYAREAEKEHIATEESLLIPWLNDYPGATGPVISANDSIFIFTLRKEDGNHIMCSYKTNGWQKPEDITLQLSGFDRLWSNSVTGNGKILVLYMDDGADGNLYYSRRTGRNWSKVRKFGKNINTKFWEAHGFITPDGTRLYFTSNRDGGYGELDIWTSDLLPDGNWGKAVNLGNRINTPYNENTPFFDPVTSTLLFSSEGHQCIGGYDTFISMFRDGTWSEPIGLPSPLNTTGDNGFFIINRSASKEYITSLVDEKTGIRNIYKIVPSGQPAENITAQGNIDLQDGMKVVSDLADVRMKSSDRPATWKKIPLKENGMFEFSAPKGNYKLHVSYSGYKTDTVNLSIPSDFSGYTLTFKSSLLPDKVYSGDFLVMRNILFDFDSYELNDQAKIELEKILKILTAHPGLNIEVSGYTDIRGDPEYNIKLSGERADAVIGYFTKHGINKSGFTRKAEGASGFVALNVNSDGSDNPSGRQYNRRVSLGIINPQTGITITPESYAPPLLRYPYSKKYSIVLMKSYEKFFPDYFKEFSMNELLFVRPILKDSLYYYVLGEFSNRPDAESYLTFAREKGFRDGYIVDQYYLAEEPRQLVNQLSQMHRRSEPGNYTVQLRASTIPINISDFRGLEGIKEIRGKDGYYRYIYGVFVGFTKAKAVLETIQRMGYTEAFIKEYDLLVSQ